MTSDAELNKLYSIDHTLGEALDNINTKTPVYINGTQLNRLYGEQDSRQAVLNFAHDSDTECVFETDPKGIVNLKGLVAYANLSPVGPTNKETIIDNLVDVFDQRPGRYEIDDASASLTVTPAGHEFGAISLKSGTYLMYGKNDYTVLLKL
ncbi:hypothetical protein [Levilactobacillus bambusae]|uniref:Uncharacterized protein n=1 Tax=Levilactobacillus bambusae TaxID=2024736 RepID=A0A2V1N0E6_9LACO|nr:hypothetical protein [Levilactobacillus bambusae]PWG00707.1 hypothetical protein DCM90_00595 [Levilactobacillus bambusae]